MTDRGRTLTVLAVTFFSCAAMAVTDGIIVPPYAVKSAVKLVLFVCVPLLYMFLTRDGDLRRWLTPKKERLGAALFAGVCVYALIVGGYFLLRGVFDFSAVTGELEGGEGVTRDNFVFVAVYISLVNSFCEELLFRGFVFGVLKKRASARIAYAFSAAAFAVYHVAIMSGWFSPLLFVLLIAGLFAGGLIFDFADDGADSVYPSWIIHMFANFGINTVGLVLFGII